MKSIEAYLTSDGRLYSDEKEAVLHQVDQLGLLIDGLVPRDDHYGQTESSRNSVLRKMMLSGDLYAKIQELHDMCSHMQKMDIQESDFKKATKYY